MYISVRLHYTSHACYTHSHSYSEHGRNMIEIWWTAIASCTSMAYTNTWTVRLGSQVVYSDTIDTIYLCVCMCARVYRYIYLPVTLVKITALIYNTVVGKLNWWRYLTTAAVFHNSFWGRKLRWKVYRPCLHPARWSCTIYTTLLINMSWVVFITFLLQV